MRMTGLLGQSLFALSVAVLGALIVGFPDFAAAWPPMPKWIVAHDTLATLFGVILLAGGIALFIPRIARPAALILAAVLLLRILLMKVPFLVTHPLFELAWYDVSENLTLVAGAWTIFSLLPRDGAAFANFANIRAGQILFALALPALGLSHFFYLGNTAPLIPAWLPFHVPLAYLTGAAHIAAGLAILFRVLPRLAATLEAVMVSLFTALIWVPMVIATPASAGTLAEICISTAISGTAWAVAASFRGTPWNSIRGR